MPDERAMADGVNLAYDPDEDPAASAGEAQAWKHGREVGRAEAAGRAEAPAADEEALWGRALRHASPYPASTRSEIRTDIEALITYRERRYMGLVTALKSEGWHSAPRH